MMGFIAPSSIALWLLMARQLSQPTPFSRLTTNFDSIICSFLSMHAAISISIPEGHIPTQGNFLPPPSSTPSATSALSRVAVCLITLELVDIFVSSLVFSTIVSVRTGKNLLKNWRLPITLPLSMNNSLIQRSASKMHFQIRSTEAHTAQHSIDRLTNILYTL